MYAAALPVAASYFFLWNPPALSENALFAYLLAMAILVRTLITLYEIPSSALAPELTDDYDERTVLASFRHFFAWVGGIGIAVFAYTFLLVPTDVIEKGQLNPQGYRTYGAVAAVLMALAILASAAGTHRHIPNLKSPPPRTRRSLRASLGEIRETLSSRSFFALFAFGLFAAVAGGMVGSMNIYIHTFFWELDNQQTAVLVVSGLLSATIALPAAPLLSARLGKKRAAIALSLLAVGFAPVPYLAHFQGWMPPPGSNGLVALLTVHNVLEIGFIIVATTLVSAMMADVVDESDVATGRRSEGLFFAARSFVSKATTGLGVMMASLLLTLVGFPDDAQQGVPPETVRNLGLGYAPSLMALYLLALLSLSAYTITRGQHEANLQQLRERST